MVYSERKKKKTHLATAYKTQESSLAKRPLRDAPTDRANILLGNDSSLPVYRPALSIPNIYLYIYISCFFFLVLFRAHQQASFFSFSSLQQSACWKGCPERKLPLSSSNFKMSGHHSAPTRVHLFEPSNLMQPLPDIYEAWH